MSPDGMYVVEVENGQVRAAAPLNEYLAHQQPMGNDWAPESWHIADAWPWYLGFFIVFCVVIMLREMAVQTVGQKEAV